jgi:hypothetical protein
MTERLTSPIKKGGGNPAAALIETASFNYFSKA